MRDHGEMPVAKKAKGAAWLKEAPPHHRLSEFLRIAIETVLTPEPVPTSVEVPVMVARLLITLELTGRPTKLWAATVS